MEFDAPLYPNSSPSIRPVAYSKQEEYDRHVAESMPELGATRYFFVSIPISIPKINNSKWRYLAFYSSSFPVMFTFGKVCRKIWLNSNVWIQKGRKSIDSTKRTFLQGRVSFIRSSAWTNPQKIRNLRVIISNCLKIAVYCCAWWLLSASVLILSYFST